MNQPPSVKKLSVFGLSHKTAPLSLRERIALEGEELDAFYQWLLSDDGYRGALILSTCNRMEIYFVAADPVSAQQRIHDELTRRLEIEHNSEIYYSHNGIAAIGHLFRVVSGLDSMVLGEPQITGQVKESYARAIKLQATCPLLNQVCHRAFRVAKRVRSDTEIQRQPVSVPYTAVLLAEQIFGDLGSKRVLLIGAGEISELAATHLKDRDIAQLVIANRSPEKAQELAQRYAAEIVSMDQLSTELESADIVITSTSAKETLVKAPMVRDAMSTRKNRPMFFIDLSVPRDIDPAINDLMNCYAFDIDDLQQVVDGNLGERQQAAAEAEAMIRAEVQTFEGDMNVRDVSPLIQDLLAKVDQVRREEMEKLFRKYPKLEGEMEAAIERSTEGVLKKVLHPALHWLREGPPDLSAGERARIIADLFGIGKDQPRKS